MVNPNQTIDEAMAEKGLSGWYAWRPNQIWTRDPEHPERYISTDVMLDGSIDTVIENLREAKNNQLEAIRAAGTEKINEIRENNSSYAVVKSIALQTFYSLRSLFSQYQMTAAITIMNNAIDQINDLDSDGGDNS